MGRHRECDFVRHLRARFPGVHVHHGPAQDAAEVMKAPVSELISGLPLLSMPLELRVSIIRAAFDVLAQGGAMVQFSYGPQPPLPPRPPLPPPHPRGGGCRGG